MGYIASISIASGFIGQADRDDIVKAAVSQESVVESSDEVCGNDKQATRALSKYRNQFEQLVGHSLQGCGRFAPALCSNFFHLVDEHHDIIEIRDARESISQGSG